MPACLSLPSSPAIPTKAFLARLLLFFGLYRLLAAAPSFRRAQQMVATQGGHQFSLAFSRENCYFWVAALFYGTILVKLLLDRIFQAWLAGFRVSVEWGGELISGFLEAWVTLVGVL